MELVMSWQEVLQLAGVIGPVVCVAATGIWWCIKRHLRDLWTRINRLQRQVEVLTDEKEALQRQYRKANLTVADQEHAMAGLQARLNKARRRKQIHVLRIGQLRKEIETLRANSLSLELKAILENRVAELQQNLQEARTENETSLARLQETALLVRQREAQLTQWKEMKLNAEEATRTITAAEEKLRQALDEQHEKVDALNEQVDHLTARDRQREEELGRKKTRLDEADREIFDLKTQIEELQARIEGTVEQKGRIWERPLPVGAVPFRPLSARKMPILSVLNLKGGVGKTTITASLGAMLGLQGSRVLLIDLDYQRSLTLLCCSPTQIKEIHNSRRSLQHFLLDPQADGNRLLTCATPVKAAEGCEIILNSDPLHGCEKGDNLEDAEMHLLAEWLTNLAGPDIRLSLRNALHSPLIQERFDYVLLDCPPRLSTACINALAASDFAIIPVMLDYTSANSAHNLLRKLRRLRERQVLSELRVLGVLANRVTFYRGKLVNAQAVVWDELRAPCQEAWGAPVHFFKTVIKQSSGVAEAAARHDSGKATRTLAAHADDLKPIFHDLVQEVKKRVEHESQRLAAVPSKPGAPLGGERGTHANSGRP
jgi:cellulose biosynthesis protein BcsQ